MDDHSNEPLLLRQVQEGIATLTLNRPQARNALSMALMGELLTDLRNLAEEREIKVVILAGSGPGFCAGHDLKELRSQPKREIYQAVFKRCSELMQAIVALPKPVIAQVHGIATAAGCQLAATCDLAVASADARFATPGVNIGLFCSTPMVALSRAVPAKQAIEMLLTGEFVDAEEARRLGLINRVVAPAELAKETQLLARFIASKPTKTLRTGKQAFQHQLELGLSNAYDYVGEVMVQNMLHNEAIEGIDAFLDKRPPKWPNK